MKTNIIRTAQRAQRSSIPRAGQSLQQYRCFACSRRVRQPAAPDPPPGQENERYTHFGFETVAEQLKQGRVRDVFSSVATSYDTMNDLMSLGIHRLWKDHFVRSLDPGINPILFSSPSSSSSPSSTASQDSTSTSPSEQPQSLNILDVAGGTGDIAQRMLDYAASIHNDHNLHVTVADINTQMLAAGRKRFAASDHLRSGRLTFIEANAERLQDIIPSDSIDLYTVAFGIRNFTNPQQALEEAYRVLKPGGVFACLEFSKVNNEAFNWFYKRWSFSAIPIIGQLVAGDRDSYQYLVESIERFPDQKTFANMIAAAGFEIPASINGGGNAAGASKELGGWEDLSGGIACIHKGVKPVQRTS